jgi:hypothetical protein
MLFDDFLSNANIGGYGSRLKAGTTGKQLRDLAARCARSFADRFALQTRGRREDRVRAAPAVSCASCTEKCAHEHTGSAESIRPSLRNGFTAYFVLSPADRACCHRRPSEALASLELDASIRGVRTTRLRRTPQPRSSVATSASTATRPTFVTMANAPRSRTGWLLM